MEIVPGDAGQQVCQFESARVDRSDDHATIIQDEVVVCADALYILNDVLS